MHLAQDAVQCQAVVNKNYSIAMIAENCDKLSAYVNIDYSQVLSLVRIESKIDRPDYCSRMATEHFRWKN